MIFLEYKNDVQNGNNKTLSRELYKTDFYRNFTPSLVTIDNRNSVIECSIPREDLTKKQEASEKGNFFKRMKSNNIFAFADQKKITYGFGYNLTLKRDTNDIVFSKGKGVAAAKVVLCEI